MYHIRKYWYTKMLQFIMNSEMYKTFWCHVMKPHDSHLGCLDTLPPDTLHPLTPRAVYPLILGRGASLGAWPKGTRHDIWTFGCSESIFFKFFCAWISLSLSVSVWFWIERFSKLFLNQLAGHTFQHKLFKNQDNKECDVFSSTMIYSLHHKFSFAFDWWVYAIHSCLATFKLSKQPD